MMILIHARTISPRWDKKLEIELENKVNMLVMIRYSTDAQFIKDKEAQNPHLLILA